jgi:hypothetical protein
MRGVSARRTRRRRCSPRRGSRSRRGCAHGRRSPRGTDGTPIDPNNLRAPFKEILRQAELPEDLRFHDLRHAAHRSGRPPAGDQGDTRPRPDLDDDGHLRPRARRHAPRGHRRPRGAARRVAVHPGFHTFTPPATASQLAAFASFDTYQAEPYAVDLVATERSEAFTASQRSSSATDAATFSR